VSGGRRQQQQVREFACETAFLSDEGRGYVKREMKERGASPVGCFLFQAPLWLLLALAVVVCWLIYCALQTAQPHAALSMLLFGALIPVGVITARRWLIQMYYRLPVMIGG
jgi:hypothetical protein